MMFRNVILILIVSAFTVLYAGSCTRENEEELKTTAICDTSAVSYAMDIIPILTQNCYECHGASSNGGSGGITLEGYSNLIKWAENGYLPGNVTHSPGYVGMPYGRNKLPDCEVNKIVAWVNQGAVNN